VFLSIIYLPVLLPAQGVDMIEYKENILPRILEQVTNCKDTIAQSYLMDCITQVGVVVVVVVVMVGGGGRGRGRGGGGGMIGDHD